MIYPNDAETRSDGQNLEVFEEKLKCACRHASTITDRTKLLLAKLTMVVTKLMVGKGIDDNKMEKSSPRREGKAQASARILPVVATAA